MNTFQITRSIAIRALRHLSKQKRFDLLSNDKSSKQRDIAYGKWYEAVIYEVLSETTKNSKYFLVAKGPDVFYADRAHAQLGQDGLFFGKLGAIVARGNGQDLAEFDLMLASKDGELPLSKLKPQGITLRS